MEVIALCVCVLISHTTIPADDDNLIILDPIPGQEDCQSDYINACYVDVSVCVLSSYFNGSLFLFLLLLLLQCVYICLMTCCIPLLMAHLLSIQ